MNGWGLCSSNRGGRLVGIVTDTDVAWRAVAETKDLDRLTVEQIMSSPIATIEAARAVQDAHDMMRDLGVRHLGVTEGGKLTGLVSVRDLLMYFKRYARAAHHAGLIGKQLPAVSRSAISPSGKSGSPKKRARRESSELAERSGCPPIASYFVASLSMWPSSGRTSFSMARRTAPSEPGVEMTIRFL